MADADVESGCRLQHLQVTALALLALAMPAGRAQAQRADENVVLSAEDAFGTQVGLESIGLYDSTSVRGFSPTVAGNVRIEGLYFDEQGQVSARVSSGSTIRVGPAAQGYPFPAPTGIVDITLRPSGKNPIVSTIVGYGPFDGPSVQLDGQFPIADTAASTAIGVSIFKEHFGYGGSDTLRSAGVVPRWRLSEAVEVTGFWERIYTAAQTVAPLYVPAGESLPPKVERGPYVGPGWDQANGFTENTGVIGTVSLGAWTIKGGLFESDNIATSGFANLVANIEPDGSAQRLVITDPPQRSGSLSGELRVSRAMSGRHWEQLLLGSIRWRNVGSRYGGGQEIDGGPNTVNGVLAGSEPPVVFGAETDEHVNQKTGGLSYGLRHGNDTEVGLSLQRTFYERTETPPDAPMSDLKTSPWLTSATVSRRIVAGVTAYASYTQGLEDSGDAPEAAANRLQPLPAIRTRQHDIGIRWIPAEGIEVIGGYFDIRKPYLTTDRANVYRALGNETHQGAELSISARPTNGLTLVAGAVLASPIVTDATQAAATIGRFPVGQPRHVAQLNVNYALPHLKSVSLDAGVTYTGAEYATDDNVAKVGAYTTATVGGRYKFTLGGHPYTLRLSVANATNTFAWTIISAGAYQPLEQRSFSLYLTADY